MLSTDGYTPSFAALGRLAGQVAGLLSDAECHSKLLCGRSAGRLGAGAAQLQPPISTSASGVENPVRERRNSSAGAAVGEGAPAARHTWAQHGPWRRALPLGRVGPSPGRVGGMSGPPFERM